MRTRPLTALTLAAALLAAPIGVAAATARAGAPRPGIEQERTVTQPITAAFHAVHLDIPDGTVTIRPSAKHALTVHETYIRDEPSVTVSVKNGVLTIGARCARDVQAGGFYAQLLPCTTDMSLTVPSSVDLTVSTANGNVDVAALNGAMTLSTGGGDVNVARIQSQQLTVRSSSGNVTVSDIKAGSVGLSTGGGNMRMTYLVAPRLTVRTSSGNVDLHGVTTSTLDASTGGGNVTLVATTAVTATLRTSSGTVDVAGSHVSQSIDSSTGGGNLLLSFSTVPRATLRTSSGDVLITGGRVDTLVLSSGGGNLTVKDPQVGSVDARTSSGDIAVTVTRAPTKVAATTGGGDVRVTVPRGRYAVTTSTGGGNTALEGITVDQSATRSIGASTSSGDVYITGR